MQQWPRNILILSILVLPLAGCNTWKNGARGEVLTNSIGMKFKLIPAGSFLMSSPDTEKDRQSNEGPVHKVTLSKPFYIGVHEVTIEQWRKVMGDDNPNVQDGPKKPMIGISWHNAQEFVRKLSEMEKVTYRLPTEAEWEYACRAGTTTAYYWGESFDAGYAWSQENGDLDTHNVGTRKPNAWGLYDMSGNVWEWCEDWYGPYAAEEQTDPKGPSSGQYRLMRGGSAYNASNRARSAARYDYGLPNARTLNLGVRIVRVP
ncbi:MAG TPA: formylglycine-generating enzyme family protein [Candidatus Sumerlaeota bacterium]|nr:formylglycine-generating enzyme family protein [Candidatus Sumerlaeota bacterium]